MSNPVQVPANLDTKIIYKMSVKNKNNFEFKEYTLQFIEEYLKTKNGKAFDCTKLSHPNQTCN